MTGLMRILFITILLRTLQTSSITRSIEKKLRMTLATKGGEKSDGK